MYICVMLINETYYVLGTPEDTSGIASWATADDGKKFLNEYIGKEMAIAMQEGIAVIIPSFVGIDGVSDFISRFFATPPTLFYTTEMFFGGRAVNAMDIDQEMGMKEWLAGERPIAH